MNIKEKDIIFTILALMLVGCAKPDRAISVNADRAEVYYRSFDKLAPISYSRSDLMRLAPVKLEIIDNEEIERLVGYLPSECVEVEGSPESLDYYLSIIFFKDTSVVREFNSSTLQFSDTILIGDSNCVFGLNDRDSIEEWIGSAKHQEK